MPLSSLQLEAFLAVARERSFSAAAKRLGLTQSALSQRVANLEKELAAALFVRTPTEPRLTEYGNRLLQHCLTRESLEAELLGSLRGGESGGLGGIVRVGGFSSVMQSALLPALAPLLNDNPAIALEMNVVQVAEIASQLRRGKFDYFLSYQPLAGGGVVSRPVAVEENVLIAPAHPAAAPDLYLDHDEDDMTTFEFFKIQKTPPKKIARSFLGSVYGLIAGVELGIGQAVVPRHLIRDNARVRQLKGLKALSLPVYFGYFEQPYYTELQRRLVATVEKNLGRFL